MRQDSGIGVLDKAVGVLHSIAESPCGLAELCDRTGLPRATAHRLAAGLEAHRLLARDGTGRWLLGPALTELAAHVHDPLLAASAAVLPRLREITGECAALPAGGHHPSLHRRAGTGRRAPRHRAGRYPAADDGGFGRQVLLAFGDNATAQAVLPAAKFTERSLAEVRRRGWAQSAAEREPGWPVSPHRSATAAVR